MNIKFIIVSLLVSFSVHAQIECPEIDNCFPQHQGQNFDVPSTNYPTIDSAIIAAPSGSNIRIRGGSYSASVVIDNKNLNIMGNHGAGKPTIISGLDANQPIFSINGSPLVKFKKLSLRNSAGAIKTDFAQNGPWSSIELTDLSLNNNTRGVSGSYEVVKIDRSEILSGALHAISLSRIARLEVKGTILKDHEGLGLYVLGNQDSIIGITDSTFDNNSAGGLMVKNNRKPMLLSKIKARNNGVAGIILDHSGPVIIDRAELIVNRPVDGKFGNGVLIYSSKVDIEQSKFIDNKGFETAMVGCGSSPASQYDVTFLKNTFFVPEQTSPPVVVFALYPLTGCEETPIGTLKDGGGNLCNGTASCKSESAGGLEPIAIGL